MAIYPNEKDFLHSFERFNVLSSPKHDWHTSISENEHRCEFGCPIPEEETFFKKILDKEGEHTVKVCWHCMERVVYLTVDSDLHAKQLTTHLKHQRHLFTLDKTNPLLL